MAARAYLYTSVYHLSLNSLRNHNNQQRHKNAIALHVIPNNRNPAEEKEVRERLHNAIETLPQPCKEVFHKSRFEGKKYAAIAGELNISIKRVEVLMGKALKILRDDLTDLAIAWLLMFIMHFSN